MLNANRIFAFLSVAALAGCSGNVNDGSVLQTVTVLVSLSNAELQGDDDSSAASVSSDGRYVAFVSKSTNYIGGVGTKEGVAHVYVRDMLSRTTTMVDVPAAGTTFVDESSGEPSISGNGRYVAFESAMLDLLGSGSTTLGRTHIYVRDLFLGTTTLVSHNSGGGEGGSSGTGVTSRDPEISTDGTFITYESDMEDLVTSFVNNNGIGFDIFRWDAVNNSFLISGTNSTSGGNGTSLNPSLSDDGNLVAYQTDATDLFSPDTNVKTDVVLTNVSAGNITLVSTGTNGQGDGNSRNPAISGNGLVIAFQSTSINLDVKDLTSEPDIYVRSRPLAPSASTRVITVHTHGNQAGQNCDLPKLDTTGRYIVYQSGSQALVTEDSNNKQDIFLRDELLKTTIRVSVATYGGQIDSGNSLVPDISTDGRYVVFESNGSDVVDNDVNSRGDIFRRGPISP